MKNNEQLWVFRAGFFLNTPLQELLHHGEVMRGQRDFLPALAEEGSLSAWQPVSLCRHESAGVDIDSITVESDIGPVPADGGDYLPFLIKFRRIIESGLAHDELAGVLEDMLSSNSSYRKFFERHGSINGMLKQAGVQSHETLM